MLVDPSERQVLLQPTRECPVPIIEASMPFMTGQNGSFRFRILGLLDEHERVEREHLQLQELLQNLRREGPEQHSGPQDDLMRPMDDPAPPYERQAVDDPATPPLERNDNDILPLADFQRVVSESGSANSAKRASIDPNNVRIDIDEGRDSQVLWQSGAESSSAPRRISSAHSRHGSTRSSDSQVLNDDYGHDDTAPTSHAAQLQQDLATALSKTKRSTQKIIRTDSDDILHAGRKRASIIVRNVHFESAVACIILTNVIYMGWHTNWNVQNPLADDTLAMRIVSLAYSTFYLAEVGIRIIAWGRNYFSSGERGWNIFDLGLVVQSLIEEITYWSGLGSVFGGSVYFLRVLRLCKLIKMLRIVRLMRSMREMRLILFCIMGSIKGMFWSLLFIIGVLYMFSLVFVQAASFYLASPDTGEREKKQFMYYFGSVHAGMGSLFLASTGGADWGDIAKPLLDVGGRFYYGLFCLYIAFFLIVLMNTITALFVEITFSMSSHDHQYTIQNVLEKKNEYLIQLRSLFEETDANGDGVLSMEEFCAKLNDPKMRAFAESLHIEIADAKHFYALTTDEGRKPADLETFVIACIKMRGQALSIDLQDLILRQRRYNNQQQEKQDMNHEQIRNEIDILGEMNRGLQEDVVSLHAMQRGLVAEVGALHADFQAVHSSSSKDRAPIFNQLNFQVPPTNGVMANTTSTQAALPFRCSV